MPGLTGALWCPSSVPSLVGRHLCEFTGLDLEMAITDHYAEVILVLHNTFKVHGAD